jgi:curved DNA-binding protein
MEFRDYYEVMGVPRDATQEQIRKAYRRLARKFHPDVSKAADAEARFKEAGEAYEVLKDPEKRAAYDQLGADWKAGEAFRPPPDWDAGFEFRGGAFADSGDYSEFFESLFGHGFARASAGRRSQGIRMRGEDHHAKVLIDIEDAFGGATRTISLRVPELNSQGELVNRTRTLKVRIPNGVRAGQRVRLAGQGAPGAGGGEPGDLYLEMEFKPHPLYQAEGRDLYLTLPVAPWEAALGARVKAPTPAGPVDLKVPPGSLSGSRLRLKGRGIPGQPPGDIYAVLSVALPPADSQRAKALYREMERDLAFDPRAALGV